MFQYFGQNMTKWVKCPNTPNLYTTPIHPLSKEVTKKNLLEK